MANLNNININDAFTATTVVHVNDTAILIDFDGNLSDCLTFIDRDRKNPDFAGWRIVDANGGELAGGGGELEGGRACQTQCTNATAALRALV